MKKIILIFSLVITLFGIFLIALPTLLKVTGFAQPIKKYLISSLIQRKPYSINLDDFKIGLGTIEFNNVALKSNTNHYRLGINTVRFDYTLSNLLLHPRNPLHALKAITLIKPYLLIREDSTENKTENVTEWSVVRSIIQKLNQKRSLKLFRIEEGQLVYQNKKGKQIILGNHLNGALKSADPHLMRIELGLIGGLFSEKSDQIEISGRMDLKKKKIRLLCRFNHYEIGQSDIEKFLPRFTFRNGILSGWLLMENKNFSPDSINMNGELNFSDFSVGRGQQFLKNINFKAVIADNRLIIDTLKAKLDECEIHGNLWVNNILRPRFTANLKVKNLSVNSMLPLLTGKWYSGAHVDGQFTLIFNPSSSNGNFTLKEGNVRFNNGKKLNDVTLKLSFSKDTLSVDRLSARMDTVNRLQGSGFYFKNTGFLSIHLHAEHHTSRHVIFDQISNKIHNLDVRFNYDKSKRLITGRWKYCLKGRPDTLLAMSGRIFGTDRLLNINLLKSTEPNLVANLQVANLLKRAKINQGFIKNFPLGKFTTTSYLHSLLSKTNNELQVTGPLNRLKIHLLLTDQKNRKNQAELMATLSHLLSNTRMLNGLIRLKNITGNTSIKFSDDYLAGLVRFGNEITGNLNIDFTKEKYLKGEMSFHHFNVVKALSDSVISNDFRFLGSIDGKVNVNGDIKNPILSANLLGDRFVFNNVGYYQAGLQVIANRDSVTVDSLFIAINNLPVIQGKGKVNFKKQNMSGFFFGHNVDAEQIMTTLAPNKFNLTGLADYTLELAGSLKKPKLNLNMNITDGVFDRIEFDRMFFHLKNDYNNGGSLLSSKGQILKIEKLQMSKKNGFELSGLGQIPLYSTGNIDLYLNFKGDLFHIIPLYQPFFQKGVSNVELQMAIGGTPERIRLNSGYMLINSGELWLQNVAPHIKNISGVIEKKNHSNQVNFINFTAETGGEPLTINTVRNVKLADGSYLKPWYFKGLNLDFGVLKMETTGRGVRVHIPALMLPKYDGHLALSGMHPEEYFYFAGPVKHPVLHGKVTVYNTRLTFPFIKPQKPSNKPNPVLNFLNNINWDIKVATGEDVVYVRNIPAYIDNVNTELFIDEKSPGLYFKGILSNHSFKVTGKMSSSRGRLEYLDQTFRVDYFQAEFTGNSPYPFVSGQAWTTIRDSIGAMPKTIYLKLYAMDPETGQEKQQGSLENFKFKLVSADPQIGEDQERVLSYLGFSMGNIKEKATSVGGAVTDKYIFRPLFRPIERAIERNFGIDFVRINSNIAKNLFYTSIGYGGRNFGRNQPLINPFNSPTPYLFLIQSSEVTLGKYLTQNLYLTYTGQLVSVFDRTKPTFDVNHSFGIEYRFLRNILLEIEYDRELMGYYKVPNQKQYLEDVKIRLRHSFTF